MRNSRWRIGWTSVDPNEASPRPSGDTRLWSEDGRAWRLYTQPFTPLEGPLWAKAWRMVQSSAETLLGATERPDNVQVGGHSRAK